MHDITISRINNRDSIFQQVWDLREAVLRKPLGLSLRNEDLSRDNTNEIFIAIHEGKVIGCVFLQPLQNNEVQLRAMAVYKEWQGKGIGAMLVKAFEEYATNREYSKIILHARKVAVGFYRSLGYVQYGDEFTEVGIPHYMMEKPLKTPNP
jgi:predicted GNAT family N-acyltransferase